MFASRWTKSVYLYAIGRRRPPVEFQFRSYIILYIMHCVAYTCLDVVLLASAGTRDVIMWIVSFRVTYFVHRLILTPRVFMMMDRPTFPDEPPYIIIYFLLGSSYLIRVVVVTLLISRHDNYYACRGCRPIIHTLYKYIKCTATQCFCTEMSENCRKLNRKLSRKIRSDIYTEFPDV